MIEITVKISNDEKTLRKRLLHEGDLTLSREDPFIISLIQEAMKEFQDEVDDVVVTCRMTGL